MRARRRKERGESAEWQHLYDAKWAGARRRFLFDHPYCTHCFLKEKLTAATVVDHIRPHCGDLTLFWQRSNWMPLCKKCHDRKTVLHDGGFGRPRTLSEKQPTFSDSL